MLFSYPEIFMSLILCNGVDAYQIDWYIYISSFIIYTTTDKT